MSYSNLILFTGQVLTLTCPNAKGNPIAHLQSSLPTLISTAENP